MALINESGNKVKGVTLSKGLVVATVDDYLELEEASEVVTKAKYEAIVTLIEKSSIEDFFKEVYTKAKQRDGVVKTKHRSNKSTILKQDEMGLTLRHPDGVAKTKNEMADEQKAAKAKADPKPAEEKLKALLESGLKVINNVVDPVERMALVDLWESMTPRS